MCVQYIGAYSVHRGCSLHQGMFSTLGEYHEYIGGLKYMSASGRGDVINTLGDVQYIGGYHDACGGYHEYIG